MSESEVLADEVPRRLKDPVLKASWLAALRSGAYQQTSGRLHRLRPTPRGLGGQIYPAGFCCMGVLCDVIDPTQWHHGQMEDAGGSAAWGPELAVNYPPSGLGLSDAAQTTLGEMNDEQKLTFEQIADWIEANL